MLVHFRKHVGVDDFGERADQAFALVAGGKLDQVGDVGGVKRLDQFARGLIVAARHRVEHAVDEFGPQPVFRVHGSVVFKLGRQGGDILALAHDHSLLKMLLLRPCDAASLRVAQRVRLREEGTGTPAEGTIVRLSPAVDEGTRTLMVEAEIPNQDGTLRPGAFATADIVVDPEQTAILVPASAIVTFAGVTKVVTVADGKAVEKRVQLGRKAGDRVEVTSGLAAGESVVAEPGSLSAGQAVVVE